MLFRCLRGSFIRACHSTHCPENHKNGVDLSVVGHRKYDIEFHLPSKKNFRHVQGNLFKYAYHIRFRTENSATRFQHFSNHKCLLLSACLGVFFIMSILCGIHSLAIIHFSFYPFHSVPNSPVIVIVFDFFSLLSVLAPYISYRKLITADNVIFGHANG